MKTYKTNNNLYLLKDWNNFSECEKIVKKAFNKIKNKFTIINGDTKQFSFDCLHYTSSSSFAGVWNCNTEAQNKENERLFFRGLALTTDFKPVVYMIEYENGEEVNDVFKIIE